MVIIYWLGEATGDCSNGNKNIIDNTIGAENTNQSARLYAAEELHESHGPDYSCIRNRFSFDTISDFGITTGEYRFYIRNGSEKLDNYCDAGQINVSRIRSSLYPYLYFYDEGNSILDFNKNVIGTYNKNQWHYIKIQVVVDNDYTRRVSCWIDGVGKPPVVIPPSAENPEFNSKSSLNFEAFGGTVWVDEVKIYKLGLLPKKSNPDFRK